MFILLFDFSDILDAVNNTNIKIILILKPYNEGIDIFIEDLLYNLSFCFYLLFKIHLLKVNYQHNEHNIMFVIRNLVYMYIREMYRYKCDTILFFITYMINYKIIMLMAILNYFFYNNKDGGYFHNVRYGYISSFIIIFMFILFKMQIT
ncbi:hypothetical protein ACJX0J_006807, partial [Zea mays]